jgi:SAM-dependent methyltransferase
LPDYDYYGLLAETWDLWRDNTENWSDSLLYLKIVQRFGEPVLDVGCGTGRILLDYLAKGVDVHGVDNSPEFLEICREKATAKHLSPTLYLQILETLSLPRAYRTILGASSVLQLITDTEATQNVLHKILDHLEQGGAYIGSFAFEWREGDPLDTGWELLFEKPRPEDGANVRSWTHEWHEPSKRLWHSEQRFEVTLQGEVLAEEHHVRSPEGLTYTQEQAIQLYKQVGFQHIQVFHEFTEEPALPEDRLFCVQGIKP